MSPIGLKPAPTAYMHKMILAKRGRTLADTGRDMTDSGTDMAENGRDVAEDGRKRQTTGDHLIIQPL